MREVLQVLDVIAAGHAIPAMSAATIGKVRDMEAVTLRLPQERIETSHLFHAGLYARSIMIPAGIVLTGALIKIPTVLIVSGEVIMYGEGGARRLTGYHVLAASAYRKQVFIAVSDVHMTMLFPTKAANVTEAEQEFTDEGDLLLSRRDLDTNTIALTGE